MRGVVSTEDLEGCGLPQAAARAFANRASAILKRHTDGSDPETPTRAWLELRDAAREDPAVRGSFAVHSFLYRLAYEGRAPNAGPGPVWVPSLAEMQESNLGGLMAELGIPDYGAFHRWSVEHREDFWSVLIRRLGIVFRKPPERILDPLSNVTRPRWLPGAELNIAESCFQADPGRPAILSASEASPDPRELTYGELLRLARRVAGGLATLGIAPGEGVALYMPMTPESVAIYLGTVLAGRSVIGIADASAAEEFEKRARIAGAKAVFTMESYPRGGKEHYAYEKVCDGHGPRAIVLPREGAERARTVRPDDIAWDDFLADGDEFAAVPCRPSDPMNVLFSSGTTKDPKAILWTHVTPIKCAADAHLHHDVRPADVFTWPTSFGWMMGPWLTYACLVNQATMGLYLGAPQSRGFGEFVSETGTTHLGVVPKLVRAWKDGGTMEGLDWHRIRLFSSTAEPSTPEEMRYLMFLAGYRPVIEYCGGTEVGGGYVTGTVVQPSAPSTFTTPALGLDFRILEGERPSNRGEVFLVPPSIGLSNELLNYDHDHEYFEGVPRGPAGEVLRRHGDQLERLAGDFYLHHGRIDDMVNIHGVKTSAEEIRSVLGHELVYDAKPVAVDLDGSGQHHLVVYVVPRNPKDLGSAALRAQLRTDFEAAIRGRLNPLLAHVHDVVAVSELPQAGPEKTRPMRELQQDYLARLRAP